MLLARETLGVPGSTGEVGGTGATETFKPRSGKSVNSVETGVAGRLKFNLGVAGGDEEGGRS